MTAGRGAGRKKNKINAKDAKDKLLSQIGNWEFSKSLDIFENVHAVLMLTEWDEYKNIDWHEVSKKMVRPAWVFDSRSIIEKKNIINTKLNLWRVGDGTDE